MKIPLTIATMLAVMLSAAVTCAQNGPATLGGAFSPIVSAPRPPQPDMTATAFDPQASDVSQSVRIKDITLINGDRNNHISGTGLVFGLSGTGGKSEQTRSMASSYFLRKGIRLSQVDTKNISAVLVSAKIPPYARKGETILVNVSVADDAKSLRGGYLNQTVLRAIDDEVYAIAQGPIIGGGIAAGGAAATVQLNHPTAGVCEAIIEREICSEQIMRNGRIRLVLQNKEYSTATQIANVLNGVFPRSTRALDSGTIESIVPRSFQKNLPAFISMIGELRVQPDTKARVVINQKTGTILLGRNVRISKVLFASENVVISTQELPVASQPAPFSNGVTAILPRTNIDVFASGGNYNIWNEGITVGELAQALNALAIPPNALINIFTSLRNQGALQAELVIE